jgi:hypothetical protein
MREELETAIAIIMAANINQFNYNPLEIINLNNLFEIFFVDHDQRKIDKLGE